MVLVQQSPRRESCSKLSKHGRRFPTHGANKARPERTPSIVYESHLAAVSSFSAVRHDIANGLIRLQQSAKQRPIKKSLISPPVVLSLKLTSHQRSALFSPQLQVALTIKKYRYQEISKNPSFSCLSKFHIASEPQKMFFFP